MKALGLYFKVINWLTLWMRNCAVFMASLFVLTFSASASGNVPFPVTITHSLGSTTVVKEPIRIVTIGWSSEDVVMALGKVPVAMPRYSFFKSGIFPWNESFLVGNEPLLLTGRVVDFERVAMLRPDLILAVSSDIDEKTWHRLSSIAPTVAYRHGAYSTDWREQTTVIGEALGKPEQAAALIEETNEQLRALGNAHPELKGKTFTFGTFFPGGNGVVVYLPKDPRIAALTELGMVPSAGVQELATKAPDETSVLVSLEDVSSVDADILIMWYGDGARAAAEAQPLFKTLDAVKRGAYVALDDPVDVWSTSALSVLSIPYGFPRFVPRLAEAAARAGGQ